MVQAVRVRVIAALLTAVALAACAASKNPVGPASEAVSEPRLAGIWTYGGKEESRRDILHIIPRDDTATTFDIIFVDHADSDWAVLDGYVTAIGERRFVNLQLRAASASLMTEIDSQGHKDSHPYSFVAYAFEGDDVLRTALPRETLYNAVKEGRLAGETSGDYDVFVSADSGDIAAFLGTVDAADLFKDAHRYQRSQLPGQP
jgi:hypothetical protein